MRKISLDILQRSVGAIQIGVRQTAVARDCRLAQSNRSDIAGPVLRPVGHRGIRSTAPSLPESSVRADRKGAVGGPLVGNLEHIRKLMASRRMLRGVPRTAVGIFRVRAMSYGGAIFHPEMVYRAATNKHGKRTVALGVLNSMPFYGADAPGFKVRERATHPLTVPILDTMAAESVTYARLIIALEGTRAAVCTKAA